MIKEFTDIIEKRHWTGPVIEMLERIEQRLSLRLPADKTLELTSLQKEAIEDPAFWRDYSEDAPVKNLVVQGATSAGKTLLSELNILDTICQEENAKAIVLVPLKAMVHERTEQFRHDIQDSANQKDNSYKVIGSSSDHLENDEILIKGKEYTVAVIVYEKFFALLSQGGEAMMSNCGLLVVDELSMLDSEQRGPKLEMSLELVRQNYPQTRIMCLATCDCKTEKIAKWLDSSTPIISYARPMGLEEHIVGLNGVEIYRFIPADEQKPEAYNMQEATIDIPGYQSEWNVFEKKRHLLLAILKRIYDKNNNFKILVFVSSQEDASKLAKFIKKEAPVYFPYISPDTTSGRDGDTYQDFLTKIEGCDFDDGQESLYRDLLPYGLAFHHAGLSTSLREVIEEEFQKTDSPIKLIVATETLTVGVNMPFDAMIMMSNLVPRGVGDMQPLSKQEYRNYIGRAGRLGQSNRFGVTYLILEDTNLTKYKNYYWNGLYEQEEIGSALKNATEEELAPYYLSLLKNRGFIVNSALLSSQSIEELFNHSLSKTCSSTKTINGGALLKQLESAYLAKENKAMPLLALGGAAAGFTLINFGEKMAPFALSIDTCCRIFCFFVKGNDYEGFPETITKADIDSDKYLLDILYHVCCHQEIQKSSNLIFPQRIQNPVDEFKAKKFVLDQLRKLLESADSNSEKIYSLWEKNPSEELKDYNGLWQLQNDMNLSDEKLKLQAALRAIVLFYWAQGKTISEIKKETGFDDITKITAGNIERMAELVSFHLDAINVSLELNNNIDLFAKKAFYDLQTRVKYGMPRDTVLLANKHVYGLDRVKLLKIRECAKEENMTPVQYIRLMPASRLSNVISPTQLEQLIQALNRRGNVKDFDTLMNIVKADASYDLTTEQEEGLRNIAEWDSSAASDLFKALRGLINGNSAFNPLEVITLGGSERMALRFKNKDRQIYFGILSENVAENEIQEFLSENARDICAKILIVPSDDGIARNIPDTLYEKYHFDSMMDTTFFAAMLAKTILLHLGRGNELFSFLEDVRGVFFKHDYTLTSLENYIHKSVGLKEAPKFRILCSNNSFIGKLSEALAKNQTLNHYEILPWGEQLDPINYNFAECPTFLFLEKEQVQRSKSLTQFLYVMQQQNFKNCQLLLAGDSQKEEWERDSSASEIGHLTWNYSNKKIPKTVVYDNPLIAIETIKTQVSKWEKEPFLIGISYAHYEDLLDAPTINDNSKLEKLAKKLAEIYGEHRILFDAFPTSHPLFIESGRERSLDAYRQCRLYLIMWNYWSVTSKKCQKERDVIQEHKSKDDKVKLIYLACNHPNDPSYPNYKVDLFDSNDSIEELVKDIRGFLGDIE